MVIVIGRGNTGVGEGMGLPIYVQVPGFKPGHSKDDLVSAKSYYHKFDIFGFLRQQHASGGLAEDGALLVGGSIDVVYLDGCRKFR